MIKWHEKKWLPLAVFSALGFEIAGCRTLFTGAPPGYQMEAFFLLHGASSMVGSAFLVGIMPLRYRQSLLAAFCFFFLICLFIPGLGLIGLLSSVWPAMYRVRHMQDKGYMQVAVPELPYQPLKVQQQPIYGQAGMVSILRHSPDPERRIKAIMATRQMNSQEAIPVLKEALRDPADDVRLLAYSMLDAMEEEINTTIRSLLARLESEEAFQHQDLHERISNSYWELAYLGLAQGAVLRHVLNRSLHHLEQALAIGARDPGLHMQRGRLLMHQQRWDDAAEAFATAVEKGVPENSVAPYLAEIAFEKRDFNQVVTFIGRLGPSIRKSERLAAIAAYWT
jgi:hypothetical protein